MNKLETYKKEQREKKNIVARAWRLKNLKKQRAYHKEYMRRYRANLTKGNK